jgi:hypothetical protein
MSAHPPVDNVLFGDNQFFGINHMSEAKAREQAVRFQDAEAVVAVLDSALDEGIRTFMCTTHERIGEVCDYMRSRPERYGDYIFFPCMPYAHKYNDAVAELGMMGALRRYAPQGTARALIAGGRTAAGRSIDSLVRLLVDAEMKMFRDLTTPVIFLQNVVVDFLMGLGFDDAFRIFAEHVEENYDAAPGFITMNLPRLLDTLERLGIENPIICSNINKVGFRMCGGRDLYEQTLRERRFRAIAMSVMASGAIRPNEAIQYVASLPNIEAIVFGASSASHIRETKRIADSYFGERDRRQESPSETPRRTNTSDHQ